ncbi:MAG: nicotinate phosphoribosyltransferase, partial [Promicromonosporaceae bacterium]|nr:nicotinate phosphoribosyltransferase [Promicromonosporaceae bacterium]
AKNSAHKGSPAGRKNAGRRLDKDGRAVEELVISGGDEETANWRPDGPLVRPLMVPLVAAGAIDSRWIGSHGVKNAIERHAASRAELPRLARRLTKGDPAIPTVSVDLGGLIMDLDF